MVKVVTFTLLIVVVELMSYKRKTQKTSDTTKRTTTQSSKGTRITNTTKGSLGGKNKRTYSWSWNKNGSMRQTTTDNRDGWITRRSRTLSSKIRKRRTSKDRKTKGNGILFRIIVWLLLLPFRLLWWVIKLPFRK